MKEFIIMGKSFKDSRSHGHKVIDHRKRHQSKKKTKHPRTATQNGPIVEKYTYDTDIDSLSETIPSLGESAEDSMDVMQMLQEMSILEDITTD